MKMNFKRITEIWLLIQLPCIIRANWTSGGNTTAPFPVSPSGEGLVDLYLLGLYPMQGPWPGGQGILPASLMALDHVNASPNMLPGYKLNIIWNDTKCDIGVGSNLFFDLLYNPPVKHLILGTGCSIVSEVVAQSSQYWNLVQISFGATSPGLSNRDIYPRFFRVMYPDTVYNPSRVALMKAFNWERVATIHQSFNLFSLVTDDLVQRCHENNITVVTTEMFIDDPALQVRNLQKHDARIIVAGAYEDQQLKIFCEAYKRGYYGPKYIWILIGWLTPHFIQDAPKHTDCTVEQVTLVASGYWASDRLVQNPMDNVTISGYTPSELEAEYQDRINYDMSLSASNKAPWGYDAVWAAALALNATITRLNSMGKVKIESFNYDPMIGDIIFDEVQKVNFQGFQGSTYFDETGSSMSKTRTHKWLANDSMMTFMIYHPESDRIEWLPFVNYLWDDNNGVVPVDSKEIIYKIESMSATVYIFVTAFASFGIILTFIFLGINLLYKKETIIRMSSPRMNNMILGGCLLVYTSCFMKELSPSYTKRFCQIRTFLIMVGFSMAFGALFSKTWRVHKIYTSKLKKVTITDSHLAGCVLSFVASDIVIFAIREGFDTQFSVVELIKKEVKDGGDTVICHQVEICKSAYNFYFLAIVYSTKGLLLAFGAFLAWETKKVTIPALNDSQYIGMCIYNVVVLSVIGVTMSFVLVTQTTLNYVLTSALLIIGTTITQLVVFVPKLLKLRDTKVHGEDESKYTRGVFTTKTQTTMPQNQTATSGYQQKIAEMKTIISLKDAQLREMEINMNNLQEQLMSKPSTANKK